MSPGWRHELAGKMIARLVEAYAEERDLPLNGFGRWTMRKKRRRRGCEADECYILGRKGERRVAQLAIEVEQSRLGIDKLDIYRGLGVGEVWRWRAGRIQVHVLRRRRAGRAFVEVARSKLLPELDLELLTRFVATEDQTASVKAFRKALRAAR